MRNIRLLFLAAALMAAAVAPVRPALQQTTAQPSLPAPTFRARTRLVQVDVVVRDKNRPVTGLTQNDFTVLDNGKPQKISVFAVKGSQNPQQPVVPLPAGAVSNRLNRNGQPPASSTILLIDAMNTSELDQPYANARIVKFLEARGNQDRIGIYALMGGVRVVQELTDDQERLNRAVNSLKPRNANHRILHNPTGPFDQSEPEMTGRALEEYKLLTATERVVNVKQALEAIAQHLAKVPGRKSLIWVTGSFPLVTRAARVSIDHTQEMKEAARALNDANVALYAVDSRGLVGGFGKQWGFTSPGLDTMNTLTGLTGGRAFYADNGIDSLIREAVEDSELIYTLGFYPAEESQNGDWHKLQVEVARRGVSVRYRENYFAAKSLPDADHRPTLNQLIRDPLDSAEVGLLAQATPDQARPGFYGVRVSVDLHDVHLEHQDARWVGGVDVSFYLEGAPSAYTVTRKIAIPDDQLAAALETGIVVGVSLGLPGPTGDVRVVVQDDATGAGGSVRIPMGRK